MISVMLLSLASFMKLHLSCDPFQWSLSLTPGIFIIYLRWIGNFIIKGECSYKEPYFKISFESGQNYSGSICKVQYFFRPLKKVTSIEHKSYDETKRHLRTLQKLFVKLNNNSSSNKQTPCHVMREEFGFSIHKKKSSIPNAGNGVFVESGRAKEGSVVALYPGKVLFYSIFCILILLPCIGLWSTIYPCFDV